MSGAGQYTGNCGGGGKGETCKHAVDELLDYLEGRLSPEEKASLDAHFAQCPPCGELLASYRQTPCVIKRALDSMAMPSELKARLKGFLGHLCTGTAAEKK